MVVVPASRRGRSLYSPAAIAMLVLSLAVLSLAGDASDPSSTPLNATSSAPPDTTTFNATTPPSTPTAATTVPGTTNSPVTGATASNPATTVATASNPATTLAATQPPTSNAALTSTRPATTRATTISTSAAPTTTATPLDSTTCYVDVIFSSFIPEDETSYGRVIASTLNTSLHRVTAYPRASGRIATIYGENVVVRYLISQPIATDTEVRPSGVLRDALIKISTTNAELQNIGILYAAAVPDNPSVYQFSIQTPWDVMYTLLIIAAALMFVMVIAFFSYQVYRRYRFTLAEMRAEREKQAAGEPSSGAPTPSPLRRGLSFLRRTNEEDSQAIVMTEVPGALGTEGEDEEEVEALAKLVRMGAPLPIMQKQQPSSSPRGLVRCNSSRLRLLTPRSGGAPLLQMPDAVPSSTSPHGRRRASVATSHSDVSEKPNPPVVLPPNVLAQHNHLEEWLKTMTLPPARKADDVVM